MYDHIWVYNGVTGGTVSFLFVKLGTVLQTQSHKCRAEEPALKRLSRAEIMKLSNQLHLLVIGNKPEHH